MNDLSRHGHTEERLDRNLRRVFQFLQKRHEHFACSGDGKPADLHILIQGMLQRAIGSEKKIAAQFWLSPDGHAHQIAWAQQHCINGGRALCDQRVRGNRGEKCNRQHQPARR